MLGIRQRSEDVLSTVGPCWAATKDEYRRYRPHQAPLAQGTRLRLITMPSPCNVQPIFLGVQETMSIPEWLRRTSWVDVSCRHRTAGFFEMLLKVITACWDDLTTRFWEQQVGLIHGLSWAQVRGSLQMQSFAKRLVPRVGLDALVLAPDLKQLLYGNCRGRRDDHAHFRNHILSPRFGA